MIMMLWGLLIFVVGILVGFVLRRPMHELTQKKLKRTKKQLEFYQDAVDQYMVKTQDIMEGIYQKFELLRKCSEEYRQQLSSDDTAEPDASLQKQVSQEQLEHAEKTPKDYEEAKE